jgi:hypothetical protein
MILTGGNRSTRRKPCPDATLPPHLIGIGKTEQNKHATPKESKIYAQPSYSTPETNKDSTSKYPPIYISTTPVGTQIQLKCIIIQEIINSRNHATAPRR